MTENKNATDIDVAILLTNGENAATCMVVVPESKTGTKFASIGRDDDGPFLTDEGGEILRLGAEIPADFDEALGYPTFRLSVVDEAGLFHEEYDITTIRPEPAAAFGA